MRSLIYIILIITLYSCKGVNDGSKNELKSSLNMNMFSSKEWQDSLDVYNGEMKKSWLIMYKPDLFAESFCGPSYNLPSIGDDVSKYDLFTVPNYIIDYDNLLTFSSNTSLGDILTLRKERAGGFLVNKNKFIFTATLKYQAGKWITVGYGPIFKQFADSLSFLYFSKNVNFYVVSVKTSAESNAYEIDFVVYENKELYNLQSNGRSVLLKNSLIHFKEKLNSGSIW